MSMYYIFFAAVDEHSVVSLAHLACQISWSWDFVVLTLTDMTLNFM